MGSSDKSWRIERYPDLQEAKDGKSNIVAGYSYGCPELGLMGYLSVFELFDDMAQKIKTQETSEVFFSPGVRLREKKLSWREIK